MKELASNRTQRLKSAMEEELEFMQDIGLFEEPTLEKCFEMTGKAQAPTKCVDVKKNTEQVPDVRCRLVARVFNLGGDKDREYLFGPMLPLTCNEDAAQECDHGQRAMQTSGKGTAQFEFYQLKWVHISGIVPDDEFIHIYRVSSM